MIIKRLIAAFVLSNEVALASHSSFPVDAILFRTHFVDALIVRKLRELFADSIPTSSPEMQRNVLPPARYDITILYDAEIVSDFSSKLKSWNFNVSDTNTNLMGLHLRHFTSYPNIKPSPISKSHSQHLAYTSWWAANKHRQNWRFVWCLEHDVSVTGGQWRRVLDAHLVSPHADRHLVSWRVGWSLRGDKVHGGGQWNIGQRHGRVGRGNVADKEVAVHFGPLVRYSAQFLDLLQNESLAGTTGHAEIVPTTLCNVTAWCRMGNLSIAVVGGRDGGLFDYKLPVDISSPIYEALEELAPGKLFHPVRDVGTASDRDNIERAKLAQVHGPSRQSTTQARYMAMCLLRNPRPPRPSYNCPFGCPWEHQATCPTVNCMAREAGTYHHMAHQSCFSLCVKTSKCPWTTGTSEQLAVANRGEGFTDVLEGHFSSVAGPV